MRVACNLVRDLPHYRREAFDAGLAACGFKVEHGTRAKPDPSHVLLVWNRYGHWEQAARKYEAAGCTVLVAENGWLGADEQGRQRYALAVGQHNGAGAWKVGDYSRIDALGVELKPWRKSGDHILVLPQRGIGPTGVAMPGWWTQDVVKRLSGLTKRPIRVRRHPGKDRPPLEPDFENCWAAVTWGSGAAVHAIIAGIPVFYEMPNWIGSLGALRGIRNLEDVYLGDRREMLRQISWAQWSVAEIASGAPFQRLLSL